MPTQLLQQETTRWKSFRQVNRNRPLKQVRMVGLAVVCSLFYFYCLFMLQPEQSHVYVIPYNNETSYIYHKEQFISELKSRQTRKVLAQRREEARLQRAKARNATLWAQRNATLFHTNSTFSEIESQQTSVIRFVSIFLSFIASLIMCGTAKCVVRIFGGDGEESQQRSSQTTTRTSRRRSQREEAFREWARRLNRTRQEQGERPLSLASLRLVVRGRDFSSGNDYEGLLQIEQEAGPAMLSLFQNMGATQHEIDRCPHRVLTRGDDLLVITETNKEPPHCAVCLERYSEGEQVRTIPCFHTFHTSCIDPWLSQKAVCPVCKHPAVG